MNPERIFTELPLTEHEAEYVFVAWMLVTRHADNTNPTTKRTLDALQQLLTKRGFDFESQI